MKSKILFIKIYKQGNGDSVEITASGSTETMLSALAQARSELDKIEKEILRHKKFEQNGVA